MRRSVALRSLAALVVALGVASGSACGLSAVGVEEPVAVGSDGGTSLPRGADGATPDDASVEAPREGGIGSESDADIVTDAGDIFAPADAAVDGSTPLPCNKSVLLLVDGDTKTATGAGSTLTAAGFTITLVANYSSYGGTPSPAGVGAVALLDGKSYPSMPTSGQDAIVAALKNGTGFVTEEWSGYQIRQGQFKKLAPYILFGYSGWDEQHTVTLASTTPHPIWDGLPQTFTTLKKVSVGKGSARAGVTSIASAAIQGSIVAPGVLVANDGKTRVAETSLAVNYVQDDALTDDANVRTLFANMTLWAAHCR